MPACQYFVLGLHDNYLVKDDKTHYILRIYRGDWRSKQDIGFELELLLNLYEQGRSVAQPLRVNSGKFYIALDCPEGQRLAVLFRYAPGIEVNELSGNHARLLGQEVAKIHQCTIESHYDSKRPPLNLERLLDQSVDLVLPFMSDVAKIKLNIIQKRLHTQLSPLPFADPFTVYCHGDINMSNFHIDGEQITIFDFDQCGLGWRAFDIGKFNSSVMNQVNCRELQSEFLAAYQACNQLSSEEVAAIPYFMCVALIWVMAIHALNMQLIGSKNYGRRYWNRKIKQLELALQKISEKESG